MVQQEPAANSSSENSSEEIEAQNRCNNVSAALYDSKSASLGKLLKIETFDEENMPTADWLLNASHTLDIAGVRDPKIYLSGIMSKLPENVLGKTRAELSRREITPEKLIERLVKLLNPTVTDSQSLKTIQIFL